MLTRFQLARHSALEDSRKRCRRLSNSHCIAGATERSPSMPSPARSPRLLRPGAWDLDVATAWLPRCWTATLRKRKGRPRRPPSLTAADRGKRPLSGLAFVRLMRRAGATASRVHLTPRAAGAPSAPTEAPPWPLPTDALGHRRSPARLSIAPSPHCYPQPLERSCSAGVVAQASTPRQTRCGDGERLTLSRWIRVVGQTRLAGGRAARAFPSSG